MSGLKLEADPQGPSQAAEANTEFVSKSEFNRLESRFDGLQASVEKLAQLIQANQSAKTSTSDLQDDTFGDSNSPTELLREQFAVAVILTEGPGEPYLLVARSTQNKQIVELPHLRVKEAEPATILRTAAIAITDKTRFRLKPGQKGRVLFSEVLEEDSGQLAHYVAFSLSQLDEDPLDLRRHQWETAEDLQDETCWKPTTILGTLLSVNDLDDKLKQALNSLKLPDREDSVEQTKDAATPLPSDWAKASGVSRGNPAPTTPRLKGEPGYQFDTRDSNYDARHFLKDPEPYYPKSSPEWNLVGRKDTQRNSAEDSFDFGHPMFESRDDTLREILYRLVEGQRRQEHRPAHTQRYGSKNRTTTLVRYPLGKVNSIGASGAAEMAWAVFQLNHNPQLMEQLEDGQSYDVGSILSEVLKMRLQVLPKSREILLKGQSKAPDGAEAGAVKWSEVHLSTLLEAFALLTPQQAPTNFDEAVSHLLSSYPGFRELVPSAPLGTQLSVQNLDTVVTMLRQFGVVLNTVELLLRDAELRKRRLDKGYAMDTSRWTKAHPENDKSTAAHNDGLMQIFVRTFFRHTPAAKPELEEKMQDFFRLDPPNDKGGKGYRMQAPMTFLVEFTVGWLEEKFRAGCSVFEGLRLGYGERITSADATERWLISSKQSRVRRMRISNGDEVQELALNLTHFPEQEEYEDDQLLAFFGSSRKAFVVAHDGLDPPYTLAAAITDGKKRYTLVCFEYWRNGVCSKKDCPYSHKDGDAQHHTAYQLSSLAKSATMQTRDSAALAVSKVVKDSRESGDKDAQERLKKGLSNLAGELGQEDRRPRRDRDSPNQSAHNSRSASREQSPAGPPRDAGSGKDNPPALAGGKSERRR